MKKAELEIMEMGFLLEAVFKVYGYDFREYSEASIRRRLFHWLTESGFATFSEAEAAIVRDRNLFDSFLRGITVNVSEMFRDPLFFKALRKEVVPFLKTYPFVKIWHAGCATGEEAYSMAILLEEEGLKGRYRIYATDINEDVLRKAKNGIYRLGEMQRYTRNYQKSDGRASFADYYTADDDNAIMMPAIKEHIVFSSHNLATDAEFGEMNLVLCRNVLIYFKPGLKERVLSLFDSALQPGGFLCLGLKESLEQRDIAGSYQEIASPMRIYRKCYGR